MTIPSFQLCIFLYSTFSLICFPLVSLFFSFLLHFSSDPPAPALCLPLNLQTSCTLRSWNTRLSVRSWIMPSMIWTPCNLARSSWCSHVTFVSLLPDWKHFVSSFFSSLCSHSSSLLLLQVNLNKDVSILSCLQSFQSHTPFTTLQLFFSPSIHSLPITYTLPYTVL